MAVRIKLEMYIPGFDNVRQLQEYISMQDALDSEPNGEPAIDPQYVTANDVLQYYYLSRMPNTYLDEGRVPTGYPPEVITVNEMEEVEE